MSKLEEEKIASAKRMLERNSCDGMLCVQCPGREESDGMVACRWRPTPCGSAYLTSVARAWLERWLEEQEESAMKKKVERFEVGHWYKGIRSVAPEEVHQIIEVHEDGHGFIDIYPNNGSCSPYPLSDAVEEVPPPEESPRGGPTCIHVKYDEIEDLMDFLRRVEKETTVRWACGETPTGYRPSAPNCEFHYNGAAELRFSSGGCPSGRRVGADEFIEALKKARLGREEAGKAAPKARSVDRTSIGDQVLSALRILKQSNCSGVYCARCLFGEGALGHCSSYGKFSSISAERALAARTFLREHLPLIDEFIEGRSYVWVGPETPESASIPEDDAKLWKSGRAFRCARAGGATGVFDGIGGVWAYGSIIGAFREVPGSEGAPSTSAAEPRAEELLESHRTGERFCLKKPFRIYDPARGGGWVVFHDSDHTFMVVYDYYDKGFDGRSRCLSSLIRGDNCGWMNADKVASMCIPSDISYDEACETARRGRLETQAPFSEAASMAQAQLAACRGSYILDVRALKQAMRLYDTMIDSSARPDDLLSLALDIVKTL